MMNSRYAPSVPVALSVILSLQTLVVGKASAEWETVPDVGVSAEHDDNVFIRSAAEVSETRSVVDARVRFLNRGQRGELLIVPSVTRDSYLSSDQNNLESTDKFLRMTGSRNWQRTDADVSIDYADESVLRSEFAGAIPGDAGGIDPDILDPDIGTGLIGTNLSQRERLVAVAGVERAISQRSRFAFSTRYLDTDYGRVPGTANNRSFENSDLSVDFIRQSGERTRTTARLTYSEFNSNRNSNETRSVGIEAIFRRSLSPIWTLDLNAGIGESDYELIDDNQNPVSDSETNLLFSTRFQRDAERSRVTLELRHAVDPNGRGFLVVRDQFRVFGTRAFSQRLNGEFGLRVFTMETVGNIAPADDRDYARLQITFDWSLRPTLFLEFGLDTISQKFTMVQSDAATSNVYFVGIRYRARSRSD